MRKWVGLGGGVELVVSGVRQRCLGGLVLKTSNLSPCPVSLVKSKLQKERLGSVETLI